MRSGPDQPRTIDRDHRLIGEARHQRRRGRAQDDAAPEIFDETMEVAMSVSGFRATFAIPLGTCAFLALAWFVASVGFAATAQAQTQQPQSPPQGYVIVTGEGSVSVAPDHARITAGVTTRAKTVKEATDANSRTMAAITTALTGSGVAQKDVQTARFSVQPLYAPQTAGSEPKLSGYGVSNQVSVIIRDLSKVGDILDRLIAAGATDVGNVAFLVSDPSKAADPAREAAVADAQRKAQLYARASGISLGRVAWIAEDFASASPIPTAALARQAASAVPISSGEEVMQVRLTVGFDISR
jgi:uncharacterized protein YggE